MHHSTLLLKTVSIGLVPTCLSRPITHPAVASWWWLTSGQAGQMWNGHSGWGWGGHSPDLCNEWGVMQILGWAELGKAGAARLLPVQSWTRFGFVEIIVHYVQLYFKCLLNLIILFKYANVLGWGWGNELRRTNNSTSLNLLLLLNTENQRFYWDVASLGMLLARSLQPLNCCVHVLGCCS